MIFDLDLQNSLVPVSVLALLLLMTNDPLHAKTTVYGLANAQHYAGQGNGPFYIQLAAFKSGSNASRYLQTMQGQSTQPVFIEQRGAIHSVVMGPFASASALRAAMNHKASTAVVHPVSYQPKPQLKAVVKELPSSTQELSSGNAFIQADLGLTNLPAAGTMSIFDGAVDPAPQNLDMFSGHEKTHGGMASLMAGWRWNNDNKYLPNYSLALRYQRLFNQAVKGTVMQYSEPDFLNYNYKWRINSDVISVFSKVNLFEYKRILPYVDVGIGYANNRSGRYSETPLSGVTQRVSPNFSSHSNSQFTYNVGTGLDFQINPQWIASLGYEFQDLGSVSSGFGQGPWSGQKLSTNKYKSNTWLISLNYLFGANARG